MPKASSRDFSARSEHELPTWMTQSQVCEWLQITRTTLWEWRQSGLIHSMKLERGGIRFRRDDVIKLTERSQE